MLHRKHIDEWGQLDLGKDHCLSEVRLAFCFCRENRCRVAISESEDAENFQICRDFLLTLRPEDYAGTSLLAKPRLVSLCVHLAKYSIRMQLPKRAIVPLICGLKCCCEGKVHWITPIQPFVFQLCIMARTYSAAQSLLDEFGTVTMPKEYSLEPKDVFLYFYYGGMIYTGTKNYVKARMMFLACLVLPTLALSSIALEAIKKMILVSLLMEGDMKPLPACASTATLRGLRSHCEDYWELARKVRGNEDIDSFVEDKMGIWQQDGNYGLVKQVKAVLRKKKLRDCGHVYSSMQLNRVRQELDISETETVEMELLKFYGALGVNLKIDQREAIIRFEDSRPSMIEITNLIDLMEKCASIMYLVEADMHKLDCSAEFTAAMEVGKRAPAKFDPTLFSELNIPE